MLEALEQGAPQIMQSLRSTNSREQFGRMGGGSQVKSMLDDLPKVRVCTWAQLEKMGLQYSSDVGNAGGDGSAENTSGNADSISSSSSTTSSAVKWYQYRGASIPLPDTFYFGSRKPGEPASHPGEGDEDTAEPDEDAREHVGESVSDEVALAMAGAILGLPAALQSAADDYKLFGKYFVAARWPEIYDKWGITTHASWYCFHCYTCSLYGTCVHIVACQCEVGEIDVSELPRRSTRGAPKKSARQKLRKLLGYAPKKSAPKSKSPKSKARGGYRRTLKKR
jgi:hypothetical protein